jgi:hypothetical protein
MNKWKKEYTKFWKISARGWVWPYTACKKFQLQISVETDNSEPWKTVNFEFGPPAMLITCLSSTQKKNNSRIFSSRLFYYSYWGQHRHSCIDITTWGDVLSEHHCGINTSQQVCSNPDHGSLPPAIRITNKYPSNPDHGCLLSEHHCGINTS